MGVIIRASHVKVKSARCYKCSKVGHLASVCHSRDERKKGQVHNLRASKSCEDATEDNEDELGVYSMYSLDTNKPHLGKYSVEMIINGKVCQMEVDTAAGYSVMSKSVYIDKFADNPLNPSKVKLKTYTGEVLDVSGEMQ